MKLIHGLHTRNLRGDIYGGITAAIIALPLALAFGVSSGAGPVAGLYGAIFVGFFAALLGGTPSQISGPTGPMTVVMAAVFTQYTAMYPDDPGRGAALAFTVVLMGGIIQAGFGLLRVGKYINLVPHPVISGFMSGIGVIIILLQLGPLFGHESHGGPLAAAQALPSFLAAVRPWELGLGVFTLLIVYGLPARINRVLPGPLLALVAGTACAALVLPDGSVRVLGDIPAGFPAPHMPVIEGALLVKMLKSAVVLALLGSIDTLLTSLVADNMTRSFHDSDRELFGQGIANALSGLFGGLPGAGATMRTVVNVKTGGRTPLSGGLHALVLLVIVLGAAPLASHIPHAVLAGILIKVGTDIIDWDYLRRLRVAPRAGVVIMFTVFFITVFIDLITAFTVGIVMASLLLVHRISEMQLKNVRAITDPSDELPLAAEERRQLKDAAGRILLFHLAGPMSFGAAKGIARRLAGIDGYDVLVLDLSEVPTVDFTSALAIEDMLRRAAESSRECFLSGTQPAVRQFLERQGTLRFLAPGHMVATRPEAIAAAHAVVDVRRAVSTA